MPGRDVLPRPFLGPDPSGRLDRSRETDTAGPKGDMEMGETPRQHTPPNSPDLLLIPSPNGVEGSSADSDPPTLVELPGSCKGNAAGGSTHPHDLSRPARKVRYRLQSCGEQPTTTPFGV